MDATRVRHQDAMEVDALLPSFTFYRTVKILCFFYACRETTDTIGVTIKLHGM
jgi:hypothetical protein